MNKQNRYVVVTTTARRFIVTAETPEAAKAQIENTHVHRSPFTGRECMVEEGIPVEKVEVV